MLGSEILVEFEKHPIFKPQTACSNKRSPSGPPNPGHRKKVICHICHICHDVGSSNNDKLINIHTPSLILILPTFDFRYLVCFRVKLASFKA